ncbi:MAG: Fe-S-containing hydro-lyase [Chitinispirillia bacterium]|nr:Fe-S-containing hydro-lyase [Chitinispirillia bacterium]MCL2268093.1 Fe-S-containing hydro-lyase [Chitinispirillia bacterium]
MSGSINTINISTPINKDILKSLRAGDNVLLTGTIYTARDAAHKRFMGCIDRGESLPLSLDSQIIYYCGPTPPTPKRCIGSAGPTTSSRMDRCAPYILRKTGLAAMIGKGGRGVDVINSIKECGAVYFAATGGAGALISSCIKSSHIICYEDLGPEAVYKFEVEALPLTVAVDSLGNDLYVLGPQEYLSQKSR